MVGRKNPVVRTKFGEVEGIHAKNGGVCFHGVPFAAPPVGPLRFSKPVDPSPWVDVLKCHKPRDMSAQTFNLIFEPLLHPIQATILVAGLRLFGLYPRWNLDWRRPQRLFPGVSEDCLYLNVETPSIEEGKRAPVVVWIHGGSFQTGDANKRGYSYPHHFPFMEEGVVLVSIQYRLGMLGFLKVEGGDYNCGFWDQIAALRWVRDNIASFGGDPGNVSIMGESAGGVYVGFHLACPHSKGLFHKAILHSGSVPPPVTSEDHHRFARLGVCKILGIPPEGLTAEYMRSLSVEQIMALQVSVYHNVYGQQKQYEAGPLLYQPVVDGDTVLGPTLHVQTLSTDLPVLIGYTRDEDEMFMILTPDDFACPRGEVDYDEKVAELVADAHVSAEDTKVVTDELKAWGAREGVDDLHDWTSAYTKVSSLLRFQLTGHLLAEALLRRGNPNVYLFRFDIHAAKTPGKAPHAVDLPYLFGGFQFVKGNRKEQLIVNKLVAHAWATFAATGHPEMSAQELHEMVPGLRWPPLAPGGGRPHQMLVVDLPVSRCRLDIVDFQKVLPRTWAIGTARRKPYFWAHSKYMVDDNTGKNGNGKASLNGARAAEATPASTSGAH